MEHRPSARYTKASEPTRPLPHGLLKSCTRCCTHVSSLNLFSVHLQIGKLRLRGSSRVTWLVKWTARTQILFHGIPEPGSQTPGDPALRRGGKVPSQGAQAKGRAPTIESTGVCPAGRSSREHEPQHGETLNIFPRGGRGGGRWEEGKRSRQSEAYTVSTTPTTSPKKRIHDH